MVPLGPRVLLVGPLPPPSGGMANQTRQLATLLKNEGIAVDLVQVNRPYRPAWIEKARGVRALFRLLPYLVALWRLSRRNDVLHLMANSGWSWHLFAAPAVLIARLRRLPVIINYRGGSAASFLSRHGPVVRPVLRMARVIAVPSGFLQEVFSGYGLRATVVPNIVDLVLFSDHSPSRERLEDGLHIVVTRNLEPIYDIDTALQAFALIRSHEPGARMTVAGSGPERERLEGEAQRLGIADAVRFSGRLERDDMARLYASAHVMLNPSRVDNTPNSVLEAWASGVVVVSTNVGGVPYLVADGVDAVLVPPADPEAMAEAVRSVIASPERYEALRAAGIRAAERFTWERVGAQWLGIYRELTHAGAAASRTVGSNDER